MASVRVAADLRWVGYVTMGGVCHGELRRRGSFAAPPQGERRKTRLMEGEARDEGSSAELSDMRRRGSSDAR